MKTSFNFSLFTIFMTTIILVSSCTPKNQEQQANEKIMKIMEQTGAVGLSVTVVKDCAIVFSNSYGLKDIESNTALTQDQLFRIASISKSFTTTALMTLVDQGKISLDTDVSDLLGFKVRNPKFPDVVIDLKKLLSHTASLNDSQGYFNLDIFNPATNPNYYKCYNDYEPGTQYEYCNLAFNTIGAIVEKYSGVRFDNYVAQTILKPLGLEASFNPDSLDATKFVTLYDYKQADSAAGTAATFVANPQAYASRAAILDSGYVMGYTTPIFSPTGGMKISANSLAKYMMMHMFDGTEPHGAIKIISAESAKLMQTPVIKTEEGEHYCFALRTTENLIPGELMTGHTGSAYGLYSAMFFEPTKGFGFVMMTNGCKPEYKDGFTAIQLEVIRALYDVFVKGK